MTFQFSTALRTAMAGAIQTIGGATATLIIYTGTEPANVAAAATGSVLATITLPATFLTSATGAATLAGTWSATATGTGTAGYFRLLDSSSNAQVQGDCTSDLILNNTSIATGQTVSVSGFTVTMGNS